MTPCDRSGLVTGQREGWQPSRFWNNNSGGCQWVMSLVQDKIRYRIDFLFPAPIDWMCRLSGPDCESRWERMASIILDYNYSFPDTSRPIHCQCSVRTTCDISPLPDRRHVTPRVTSRLILVYVTGDLRRRRHRHKFPMIMQPCPLNVVNPSWNWQFLQCYVSVEPIWIPDLTLCPLKNLWERKINERQGEINTV